MVASKKKILPLREKLHKKKEKENLDDDELTLGWAEILIIGIFIGAGFVAMPYTIFKAGLGVGLVLILLMALITDYTITLLDKASRLSGKLMYTDMVRVAFGPIGHAITTLILFISYTAGLVGYAIIIGDILTKIVFRFTDKNDIAELREEFWGRREFLVAVATLLILLPLSLYRNLGALAKWVVLVIAAAVTLIIFVAVRLATLDIPASPDAFGVARIGFFQSITILAFAYGGHNSIVVVIAKIRNPTEARIHAVAINAVGVVAVCYLAMAILGYATFTEDTLSNILENYCSDDNLMTVGRFLYVTVIFLSFVLSVYVLRELVETTVLTKYQPTPLWRHVLLTLALVALVYGCSLITDCLGTVLTFTGILASLPIGYVIPELLVLKLQNLPLCSSENVKLYLVLAFAITTIISGLVTVIKDIVDDAPGCTQGEEPAFCLDNFNNTV